MLMVPPCFFLGEGKATSSSSEASGLSLDGLNTQEAKLKVIQWLEAERCGARKINYKLRDWLFARQRYWGEPFPVSFPEGSTVSPELMDGTTLQSDRSLSTVDSGCNHLRQSIKDF